MIFYIRYSRLFKVYNKKHEAVTDNSPIRTYMNKNINRILFQAKKGYCLKLLTQETTKLLGSTNSIINENEKGKMYLI